jgi:hypothetical protein
MQIREVEMRAKTRRVGLIAAGFALIGTACGRNSGPMDAALKNDLAAVGGSSVELAPRAQPQVVISPIEAGPQASPVKASRKTTPKVPTRAAPERVAVAQSAPPTPTPTSTVRHEISPATTAEPAPLPPMSRAPAQRQQGTYKTEAEVFRQMPWIKP